MGIPVPIGTGLFKLLKRATRPLEASSPETVPSVVEKGLLLGNQ